MKNVQLLIKPASGLCNMRCRYCFYADITASREIANLGMMSSATARQLIQSAFASVDPRGTVSFAFQGGEPTMAGLDFFRDFTAIVSELRPAQVQVSFSIQTNGLVIDEAWADFLHEHHFLVGVSVDGDKSLHDASRVDASGQGTYQRVSRVVALLLKKQVEVNLLCVVTGQCARHPQKMYQALKRLGVRHLQFIPCLDPLEEAHGSMEFSLRSAAYGEFLCGLFDAWYLDWQKKQYCSIRLFEDYVQLAMGFPGSACSTAGKCGGYFVAESDGSLYPCDFYVLDKWNAGQVTTTFDEVAEREPFRAFLEEGTTRPAECAACSWKALCNGGCKRDWVYDEDGAPHNIHCTAFQRFFAHAGKRIAQIAGAEIRAYQSMG